MAMGRGVTTAMVVALLMVTIATDLLPSGEGSPLFVRVAEGMRKCFLEDVPADTLVLVKYKSTQTRQGEQPHDPSLAINKGWIVTVDGPSNEFIARRELASDSGRYAFTSQQGGEHRICLQSNTGRWFASGAEFVRSPPSAFIVSSRISVAYESFSFFIFNIIINSL